MGEKGKSCPTEILEVLAAFGAEGRPIWKPMLMQAIYRINAFVTKKKIDGKNKYIYKRNGRKRCGGRYL
ncbi:MAG: hypothetical protein K2O71_04520 [Lachnospiraceae bacterium]|nr:hypothetical protein [Lachnospiraceae bacterium]